MDMPVSTVGQYLASLPDDRRAALEAVRAEINRSLPAGYEEGAQFGMISWYVPLSTYPRGYGENRKVPLPLLSLGSLKSHMALYMLCFYGNPALSLWFAEQYAKSGKKLDMGQGCVRFKTLGALALDVVGRTLAGLTPADHIANYQKARETLGKGKAKAATAKKSAPKKSASKKTEPK